MLVYVVVSIAAESSGVETSPSTVISPEDAPSNQAAVTNGDVSESEHAHEDASGHVEESTYEPVSVGAQVGRCYGYNIAFLVAIDIDYVSVSMAICFFFSLFGFVHSYIIYSSLRF